MEHTFFFPLLVVGQWVRVESNRLIFALYPLVVGCQVIGTLLSSCKPYSYPPAFFPKFADTNMYDNEILFISLGRVFSFIRPSPFA